MGSEVGGAKASGRGIKGYGKGKVPERWVCGQCICKGIECEWDEGGKGELDISLFWSSVLTKVTGTSCQQCRNSKIHCVVGVARAPTWKKAWTEDGVTPCKISYILLKYICQAYCYGVIYQRPTTELLSLMAVMSEGLGFNLCVAPFLNVCVPNLPQRVKDGVCWRWSESGQRCCTGVR